MINPRKFYCFIYQSFKKTSKINTFTYTVTYMFYQNKDGNNFWPNTNQIKSKILTVSFPTIGPSSVIKKKLEKLLNFFLMANYTF